MVGSRDTTTQLTFQPWWYAFLYFLCPSRFFFFWKFLLPIHFINILLQYIDTLGLLSISAFHINCWNWHWYFQYLEWLDTSWPSVYLWLSFADRKYIPFHSTWWRNKDSTETNSTIWLCLLHNVSSIRTKLCT
jgi:hypothetical protein